MISRDSIRSLQGPKARERCRHWADVCTKNGGLEITVSTEKGGSDAQRHGLNVFMYVCVSLYIYISVYSIHLYICIVYHRYPTLQSWTVFFLNLRVGTDLVTITSRVRICCLLNHAWRENKKIYESFQRNAQQHETFQGVHPLKALCDAEKNSELKCNINQKKQKDSMWCSFTMGQVTHFWKNHQPGQLRKILPLRSAVWSFRWFCLVNRSKIVWPWLNILMLFLNKIYIYIFPVCCFRVSDCKRTLRRLGKFSYSKWAVQKPPIWLVDLTLSKRCPFREPKKVPVAPRKLPQSCGLHVCLGWLKIVVSFEWETNHTNWCVGFCCSYIVASFFNVALEQHGEWKVSKATLIRQWSFLKWVLINPCEGGAIYFDPGEYIFLHDGWMDTSLLESVEGLRPEATSASKCWETLRSWECLNCRFKDFFTKERR